MADQILTALTPLFAETPARRGIGAVTIAEVTDIALASLAERAGAAEDLARRAAGAGIPLPPPEGYARGETLAAFWIGPGAWMVEAPLETHDDIVARLAPAFGTSASLTDQTDGWARLRVTTGDPAALLERLCNIDPARLHPGTALRSTIEHMATFILTREPGQFDLLSPRSTATDFLHALENAAKAIA